MFGFALMLGDGRYMVMAGVLAAAMLVSGLATRALHVRTARRAHAERRARYRRHLGECRARLDEAAGRQRLAARILYPRPAELWAVAVDASRVWERRHDHPDFLRVSVGTGAVPASLAPGVGPAVDPLAELDHELDHETKELAAAFAEVADQPLVIDLPRGGVVAFQGAGAVAREAARAVISQLAVFRAPDDLRLAVFHPPDADLDWTWAGLLPHARREDGAAITSDSGDLADIVEQLIRPRLDHLERVRESGSPHRPVRFSTVVVVIDGYTPHAGVGRLEAVDELLGRAAEIDVLALCLVEAPTAIPSAVDLTVAVDRTSVEVVWSDPVARPIRGRRDGAPLELCVSLARLMSPLALRTRSGRTSTLESPGLVELLAAGPPDRIDIGGLRSSRAADLTTPIGVTEDGTPMVVDLRESAAGGMGPHGMLIGATGSGKSETLRTLVLGLALTHSADDLAFVLVDYKGGATFARMDRLPHVAGMITNLEREPGLVGRMLEALHGELEHRQRLLHHAGGFDRADEYRAHRRDHPEAELEPLPSLVVVVDEFAELISAEPRFAELFATIGRLGRSLGVHLLLSTQRLDDGRIHRLEGHLRYRLCLRTFTAEESNAVIGSRAAAELPPLPGVGYLKVDGSLVAFKSGLVNRQVRGSNETEMALLVEQLVSVGETPARAVWLEPLPDSCTLAPFDGETTRPGDERWLRAAIGWEDDPRAQAMRPHEIHLTGDTGNLVVVGAPRTGKSTLLSTMVVSLALRHDPTDLQVYALDLGGGGLHLVEGLPHVGAVLGRSHLAEILVLLRRLSALVEERADAFRRHRIADMTAYHRLRREGVIDDDFGEVVLAIDNWAGLAQDLDHAQMDLVHDVITRGLHHGVHVVATAARWQDLRLAVRDNIGGRFELRLSDPIDSEIDRGVSATIPTGLPGRGIGPGGRMVQVALPRLDGSPDGGVTGALERTCRLVADRWVTREQAPPVRTLPATIDAHELPAPAGAGVVMGLEETRMAGWEVDLFGAYPHLLVLGDGESGKTNTLRLLLRRLAGFHGPDALRLALVDYRRQLHQEIPEPHRFGVAGTPEAAASLVERICADLASRRLPDDVRSIGSPYPHLVMVVDDQDLVAGAMANPLAALADLLPRGRDLGFHLVVARRVGGLTRASFEPVLQRMRELGTPSLVLSGDPVEGTVAGGVKARPRPPGRGVWVSRARTVEVHVGLVQAAPGVVEHLRREAG
jgi:S-DNA-T family DNA segregation ATPase FtsK/SpoIIIE